MSTGNGAGSLGSGEDRGPQMNIVVWLMTGLSSLFLGLRLYCKFLKGRGLWWDDYLLSAAWCALAANSAMVSVEVTYGFGKHVQFVEESHLPSIQIYGNIASTTAILAAVWSKTSFGLTLLRITEGKMKPVVWFILVSMNICMHLHAIFPWIQCNPVAKTWNQDLEGSCWDPKVNIIYGMFASSYSGVVDICLALLPWSIVWNLQMKQQEKIGVAVAMSMGIFAGCMAFLKAAKIPLLANGDFTYDGYNLVAWASAEDGTTIMAASIPVLRVLIREVKVTSRKKYGLSSSDQAKGYGTGSVTRTNTVVVAGGQKMAPSVHVLQTLKRTRNDNHSDESVLIVDPGDNKILQTQEVDIQYHRRDERFDDDRMV